jgi:hypothetical protein
MKNESHCTCDDIERATTQPTPSGHAFDCPMNEPDDDGPCPGDVIAYVHCPGCGVALEVMHGNDEPGDIGVLTRPDADEHIREVTEYTKARRDAEIDGILAAAAESLRKVTAERDALWTLLDDIDTLDDVAKSNEKIYRSQARALSMKRHEIVEAPRVNTSTTVFPNPGGMQHNINPATDPKRS